MDRRLSLLVCFVFASSGLGQTFMQDPVVSLQPSNLMESNTTLFSMESSIGQEYTTEAPEVYTTAMKYGYGTIAVIIISLLAFVGLLTIPLLGSRFYDVTMQLFIALGIGSLSGDALFHLIPGALGLGHDHGVAHEHAETPSDENDYLWKLSACAAGIYFMFLLEKTMKLWGFKHQPHNMRHNHNNKANCVVTSFSAGTESENEVIENNWVADDVTKPDEVKQHDVTIQEKGDDVDKSSVENPISHQVCGLPVAAIMIFFGDGLHNFGDGIALGVAFSESWVTGVGTALAVFCHELPHEFSGFALYLNSGLNKTRALLLNFAAACCCFLGLYVGLIISDDEFVRPWLVAVIAGTFIYIAFVNVFPELSEGGAIPIVTYVLHNIGLLTGWTILLLIAIYEEDIQNSLQ